jgi:hypothetical protein
MKPRILILLLCYAICITTACKKDADETAIHLNTSTLITHNCLQQVN